jgi:hypothetical protein
MKKLFKATDIVDVLTIFGIFTIGFGLWLYKPWLSLFVVGIIIFSLGIFLSIPKAKKGKRK